jgi:hypothetical protein
MNQKSKITSTVSHLLQGEHLPSTKLKQQDKKVETLGHPRKCKLLQWRLAISNPANVYG